MVHVQAAARAFNHSIRLIRIDEEVVEEFLDPEEGPVHPAWIVVHNGLNHFDVARPQQHPELPVQTQTAMPAMSEDGQDSVQGLQQEVQRLGEERSTAQQRMANLRKQLELAKAEAVQAQKNAEESERFANVFQAKAEERAKENAELRKQQESDMQQAKARDSQVLELAQKLQEFRDREAGVLAHSRENQAKMEGLQQELAEARDRESQARWQRAQERQECQEQIEQLQSQVASVEAMANQATSRWRQEESRSRMLQEQLATRQPMTPCSSENTASPVSGRRYNRTRDELRQEAQWRTALMDRHVELEGKLEEAQDEIRALHEQLQRREAGDALVVDLTSSPPVQQQSIAGTNAEEQVQQFGERRPSLPVPVWPSTVRQALRDLQSMHSAVLGDERRVAGLPLLGAVLRLLDVEAFEDELRRLSERMHEQAGGSNKGTTEDHMRKHAEELNRVYQRDYDMQGQITVMQHALQAASECGSLALMHDALQKAVCEIVDLKEADSDRSLMMHRLLLCLLASKQELSSGATEMELLRAKEEIRELSAAVQHAKAMVGGAEGEAVERTRELYQRCSDLRQQVWQLQSQLQDSVPEAQAQQLQTRVLEMQEKARRSAAELAQTQALLVQLQTDLQTRIAAEKTQEQQLKQVRQRLETATVAQDKMASRAQEAEKHLAEARDRESTLRAQATEKDRIQALQEAQISELRRRSGARAATPSVPPASPVGESRVAPGTPIAGVVTERGRPSSGPGMTPPTPLGARPPATPSRLRRRTDNPSTSLWWLVKQKTLGPLHTEFMVVAHVLGRDANGVLVVQAFGRGAEAGVGPCSRIIKEVAKDDEVVWLLRREAAAALDSETLASELHQFEDEAAGLREQIAQMPWQEIFEDDGEEDDDHSSSDEDAVDEEATLRSAVRICVLGRGETGTVKECIRDVVYVRMDERWADRSARVLVTLRSLLKQDGAREQLTPSRDGRPAGSVKQSWASDPTASPGTSAGTVNTRPEQLWANPGLGSAATGRSQGTSLSSPVSLTAKERLRIAKWPKQIQKANCTVRGEWTQQQFRDNGGPVLNQMRGLRDTFSNLILAPHEMSEAAIAFGVWKQFGPNAAAKDAIQRNFRINKADEAVSFNPTGAPWSQWLDSVFKALTGVDFAVSGRQRQMAPFKLTEGWRFEDGKNKVNAWVDCIRDAPLRETWVEVARDINGLLEVTGFARILTAQVVHRAESWFHDPNVSSDPNVYWTQVSTLVIECLEGRNGIHEHWTRFKHEGSQYEGLYKREFQEIQQGMKNPATVGLNPAAAAGVVRKTPDVPRRAQPWRSQVNAVGASSVKFPGYVPLHEALPHRWEPCEFHIHEVLTNPKNTLTREEITSKMHVTGACLNLNNPLLYCTVHPGGAEALLQRRTAKSEAERKSMWAAQLEAINSALRVDTPARVNLTASVLQEQDEGLLYTHADGVVVATYSDGDGLVADEMEPPCF